MPLWLSLLLACRQPPAPVEVQPELSTGWRQGVAPFGGSAVVVTAHPEASRIGAEILASGGNAADAAVAAAVALTLVEPQSSGLGGGLFLLHFDAESGVISAWDGRETAPAAVTAGHFVVDGRPMAWADAVPGGRSIGTPGVVRTLEAVREAHGSLPWSDLLTPTIELAERGFTVTTRLEKMIRGMEKQVDPLRKDATAKAYFYPDGNGLVAGDVRPNPDLAQTLGVLARDGADAFYVGALAAQVAVAARAAGGSLDEADLAAWRPVRREPVCGPYRQWTICGHPPPSSGGVAVLQVLGQLERNAPAALDPTTSGGVHRIVESLRLAFADRGAWIADPDQVAVPVDALIDRSYLASRGALIGERRAETVAAGELAAPPAVVSPPCHESDDTTHLVVVDASGDVVTLTSSIENAFGSGVMVGGFLLNNQLTDFELDPAGPSGLHPNAAAPCKRPRSSMSPTLVLDADGRVVLALGSPGGSRIIGYVSRVLVDVLDLGRPLQTAIGHPNFAAAGGIVELESGGGSPPFDDVVAAELKGLGHEIKQTGLNSGLHGVMWDGSHWIGGVDPRRDGVVAVPTP